MEARDRQNAEQIARGNGFEELAKLLAGRDKSAALSKLA